MDWAKGVTFPRPGVLRWEEISSDFTTIEPRELELAPVLLNYRSPWSGSGPAAFRHYDVAQLAELYETSKKSNAQPLTNAIVLVSYYGAGLGDVGTTSLAANQPRAVLHSTALNDLIQRNWLNRSARWMDALLILALIPLGAIARLFRGTLPLLLFWIACVALAAVLSAVLIIKTGWVAGAGYHECSLDSCDLRRAGTTTELRIHAEAQTSRHHGSLFFAAHHGARPEKSGINGTATSGADPLADRSA